MQSESCRSPSLNTFLVGERSRYSSLPEASASQPLPPQLPVPPVRVATADEVREGLEWKNMSYAVLQPGPTLTCVYALDRQPVPLLYM